MFATSYRLLCQFSFRNPSSYRSLSIFRLLLKLLWIFTKYWWNQVERYGQGCTNSILPATPLTKVYKSVTIISYHDTQSINNPVDKWLKKTFSSHNQWIWTSFKPLNLRHIHQHGHYKIIPVGKRTFQFQHREHFQKVATRNKYLFWLYAMKISVNWWVLSFGFLIISETQFSESHWRFVF